MPNINIGPPPKPLPKKPLERLPTDLDMFEQLLPCSWNDLMFPVSSLKVSLTSDLVEHKYYGVAGANVEATGRNPLTFEATIPFFNGIVAGKNEHWDSLYPNVFRKFVKDFAEQKTGKFQHPELGVITCKAHSLDFHHDPHRRDGVEVTAHWVETVDPSDEPTSALSGDSPVQQVVVAVFDLDASLADIRSLAPDMPQFQETLSSMLGKVRGVADSVTAEVNLIKSQPAAIVANIKRVQDSAAALHTCLTSVLDDSCERSKEGMRNFDERHERTFSSRRITRLITQNKNTLASLIFQVPWNSIDDLRKLNPSLLSALILPAGTVVRCYASR